MFKSIRVIKPFVKFTNLSKFSFPVKNFSRDTYHHDSDIKKKLQDKWEIKQGLKKEGNTVSQFGTIKFDVRIKILILKENT
jgi:hypothetical protein